jgi:hypothetical protein
MKDKNESIKKFQANPPEILRWEGQQEWQKPRHEVRYFHHRRIEGWSGYVKTTEIKGWVDNIRIALFVEKWKRDHGGEVPTNDEILDWMVNDPYDEFALKNLSESIIKNGVRQQIVVEADGTLLDGNRRYFASLLKLRESEKKNDIKTKQMVNQLPAFVLSPACSQDDLDAVLVEENFVDDCRREWPNFIKAQRVFETYRDLREVGESRPSAITRLVELFGKKKSEIERWIRMMNLIDEFHDFHVSPDEESGRDTKDEYDVKWVSQERFEYFDELTKTEVARTLELDTEFRDKVFERLYAKDFKNFAQVRKLPAIANDPRARDKFMLGDGTKAVEDSIQWVTITGIAKRAMEVNDRILSFARFLGSLTANDIDKLDRQSIDALHEISNKVAEMAEALD